MKKDKQTYIFYKMLVLGATSSFNLSTIKLGVSEFHLVFQIGN